MKVWGILGVLAVSFFLFSCGPGKTTQEAEDEQIQEQLEKEKAIYAPLAGTFRGTLKRTDRKVQYKIDLILETFSYYEPDPKRGKRREVPGIRGSIIVYEAKSVIFAFQYSEGFYEPEVNHLVLRGRGIGAEDDVARDASLDAIVNGDRITGTTHSSVDPAGNKIDVTRIREKK